MIDVFALGQCTFDRLAPVDAFAAPDAKVEVAELREQVGGPAATAAMALARWGRRCALGGVIGDDAEGRRIREGLEADGIDCTRLLVRAGGRSQAAFIAVERGTGRRTIYWRRPTGAAPAPGEIAAPPARVLLTDGLYAGASVDLARGHPCVVVDAGTLREGTEALLPLARVFVASEGFARAFHGDDPAGACRAIRDRGPEVAGVTLGALGYVALLPDGTLLRRPAHRVDAVDTTGCGDIFHAGLVEGILGGWTWERCFDFAAWAAARAATRLGNRDGLPGRGSYPGPS